MAVHGKNAKVFFGTVNLSGDSNRVGFEYSNDIAETTCFTDLAKKNVEGLYGWAVPIAGYWESAENQIDAKVQRSIGAGTQVISVFPNGTAQGAIGYEGMGILSNYATEATIGGAVTYSADVIGDKLMARTKILTNGTAYDTGGGVAYNLGTAGLNKGISAVARVISGGTGNYTTSVWIYSSSTEEGTYGAVLAFDVFLGTDSYGVQFKTIGTAASGPWYKAWWSVGGAQTRNVMISCATEE